MFWGGHGTRLCRLYKFKLLDSNLVLLKFK